MAKAKTVEDVVLGEAKAGDYADMVAIASVIENRARQLGVTYDQVVQDQSEFNAYNKSLPPGVNQYRDLAQKAVEQVKTLGPVHNATFYATPKAKTGLPSGLSYVTETAGHEFFTDPQNRAIGTSVGYVRPNPELTNIAGDPPNTLYDVASPPAPLARPDLATVYNPNEVRTSPAEDTFGAILGTTPSGSKGTLSSFDMTGLSSSAQGMVSQLAQAGFGSLGVNSGYRSPTTNRRAGGAKASQHIHGNAVDLATKDLPTAEKSRVLDAALSAGAKGIGLYNSGAMHIDTRSTPGFWGPDGHRNPGKTMDAKIANMPEWSQADLRALVNADGYSYLPSGINKNVPTPTARPAQAPQFNQSRFASGAPIGLGQLSGALSQQAAGFDGVQKPDVATQAPPAPSIPASVLADQYKQYGVGQKALRDATLLGLDVAGYDPKARLKDALVTQSIDPSLSPVSIDATIARPPVVSPPRPVVPAPAPIVSAPQVSRPAPSMAPPVSFSGQDVWSGRSNTGIATNGNQLTRNPDGSVSRVSSYGYTETMNPDGSFRSTTAPGLFGLDAAAKRAFGNIGRQPGLNLGSRAKNVAGSAAGAMVGGAVLGPIGALLGGYLGKQTVQGKNPLGGLFGRVSPQQTVQGGFTGGLSFPSRPNAPANTGDGELTQFGREAARGDHGGRNSQAGRAARGEISGLF